MSKDINFQLGEYVGEYIVDRFLPSLSIDKDTRTVFQCTIGEADEYNRLDEIWFKAYRIDKLNSEKEWNAVTEYRRALELRYLPHTLRCHLSRVTPTDMDSFLDGIIDSLWHSDVCTYLLDKDSIEFTQEKYNTIIKFKLR